MLNQKNISIDPKQVERILFFISRPFIEIFYGIKSKSLDWLTCIIPGCVFNLFVTLGLDRHVFRFLKLSWLLPPTTVGGFLVYCFIGIFSGFLGWGLWQTALHNLVSKKLTEVFHNSGLKNAMGKLPSFVFDKPIDEYTRRMRLTRANLPVSSFIAAKDSLESALQVYIDEIKEHRERGTVDIVYAATAIPTEVKLNGVKEIGPCKFLIGETRARKVIVDLRETPHFLVGGQSGGGKSTFLRQIITTLYLNNTSFEFVLIDLKGGLEFQTFENLKRISVVPNSKGALEFLERLEESLQKRMSILK